MALHFLNCASLMVFSIVAVTRPLCSPTRDMILHTHGDGDGDGVNALLFLDLLHLILSPSYLDLQTLARAAPVCKLWRSVISSLHPVVPFHPWFFLFGFNRLLPERSQGFAFDPDAFLWRRLPPLSPLSLPSYSASFFSCCNGGAAFSVIGVDENLLCYTSNGLLCQKWSLTSPMKHSRYHPLVAFLNPQHGNTNRKILVVGGDGKKGSVELYDEASGEWEDCPSIPSAEEEEEEEEDISGWWLSCAVHGGRVYMQRIHSGNLCCFDMEERRWTRLEQATLRESNDSLLYAIAVVSCPDMLISACLCKEDGGHICLKLYEVSSDDDGRTRKEMSRMPSHLFSLFYDSSEEEEGGLNMEVKCCGGDNGVLFFYSDSPFKDYACCMCRVTKNSNSNSSVEVWWNRIPALPSVVNRFDRVLCLASLVHLNTGFPSTFRQY